MDTVIDELIAAQPAAFSLHQALYNSETAFRRDLERVVFRHWLLAGHAASVPQPGDWVRVDIAEESIIIVRGRDRHIRAFANVCRHRGSHICREASGSHPVLVCPYHAWGYGLDGTLVSARHMPADFDKSQYGLKPVHIQVAQGLLFISLAETPPDFAKARAAIEAAFAPYGWAEAKIAHRQTYPIDANWKLAVENYVECYHCAPAHPEYSKLHAIEKPVDKIRHLTEAMHARTAALGVHVPEIDHRVGSVTGEASIMIFRYPLYDGVKSGAPEGAPVAPLMGAFTDYDGAVTSAHVAPSSFFIAYTDHGVIYRFFPISAGRSALELIWLVRGDAVEGVDYDLGQLTWLWDVTTQADKRITEDNQKGVNSKFYTPGPYAPVEQNAIAWIAWYLNELT